MTASWPELQQQFSDLKVAARTLRLDRTWGTGTTEHWFTICEDQLAKQRFEALAVLAAQLIQVSGGLDLGDEFSPPPDLLHMWYQVVWHLVGPTNSPMYGQAWNDGKDMGSVFSSSIYKLAEASAVAALKLQALLPPPKPAVRQSFWKRWVVPVWDKFAIPIIVTVVGGLILLWLTTRK